MPQSGIFQPHSPASGSLWQPRYGKWIVRHDDELIVKDNVQQRVVNLQFTVVIDESQSAEFLHEKADSCNGSANRLREDRKTDLRNGAPRSALLSEVGHQEKRARQPLLIGVQDLVDHVLLDAD